MFSFLKHVIDIIQYFTRLICTFILLQLNIDYPQNKAAQQPRISKFLYWKQNFNKKCPSSDFK